MSMLQRDLLLRQFAIASALLHHHLDTLGEEECLWGPAAHGPHIHREPGGGWVADWPEHERYDLGPPSAGWILWHIIYWWSMALDHSFGAGSLRREDIGWPGSAAAAVALINDLERRWIAHVETLGDGDLASSSRARWPMTGRPFADIVAWANIELAKNAAELGLTRFLFAVRDAR